MRSLLSFHLMFYSFFFIICAFAALIGVSSAMASEHPGQIMPIIMFLSIFFCWVRGGLKTG